MLGIVLIGIAIRLPNPPLSTESPTSTPISPTEPAPTQVQIIPSSTTSPPISPTDIPIPSPTLPGPTKEPTPEIIPFGSSDNPSLLNAAFGWQPGNAPINAYDLSSHPNALTLITDGHTDQWAEFDTQPVIFYPIEGNFETQVKVVFNPIWGHEFAALGV